MPPFLPTLGSTGVQKSGRRSIATWKPAPNSSRWSVLLRKWEPPRRPGCQKERSRNAWPIVSSTLTGRAPGCPSAWPIWCGHLEQIVACYRVAAEAGVDRAYVYDGQGAARPEAIRFLTRFIRDLVGPQVEIAAHVHDTFGLSQANAVAALTNGASAVDAVPLGLGDGAGITASEEIAAAMEILYGVPTGNSPGSLAALPASGGSVWDPHAQDQGGGGREQLPPPDRLPRGRDPARCLALLGSSSPGGHRSGAATRLWARQAREGRSGAVAALLDSMGVSPTGCRTGGDNG